MIRKELVVSDQDELQRLDVYLTKELKNLTRSKIQKLIDEHMILVNGVSQKSSFRLRPGDRIEVQFEESTQESVYPVNIPLKIIYSDDQIAVID